MIAAVDSTGGEVGPLARVVVKHASDAFRNRGAVSSEWRALNFTAAPDFERALEESEAFIELLRGSGAEVLSLPAAASTSLDSIYVRDAAIVSPKGVILCSMGKAARTTEPPAQRESYEAWGLPIAGAIRPPGRIEGGDVVWLDERTVAVGRGYRTNDEGIQQFRALLAESIDELIVVPLPHWRGPADVFHLMSIISPVDRDLSVIYAPLMPVPFLEILHARGMAFVEVPDAEFESMGTNVLAVAPRDCVLVDGNPRTVAGLERAGARVRTYKGNEISLKGGGGPTCLTRPLSRLPL